MIYVTVGGPSSYGFLRLIKKMDEISAVLGHNVIMQIGNTNYRPTNAVSFRYNPFSDAERLFKEADLVVSHCSTGTVLQTKLMRRGRPTIVVPRRKKLGEHFDDHQLELAHLIEKKLDLELAVVFEINELEQRVRDLLERKIVKRDVDEPEQNSLLMYLKEYVEMLKSYKTETKKNSR